VRGCNFKRGDNGDGETVLLPASDRSHRIFSRALTELRELFRLTIPTTNEVCFPSSYMRKTLAEVRAKLRRLLPKPKRRRR
jgi:hypothetical protein